MLGPVDADQHEFIFHGEGRNFTHIEADADLPREEFFQGERAGKVRERQIVVQFDKMFAIGLRKKLLPGILPASMAHSGTADW